MIEGANIHHLKVATNSNLPYEMTGQRTRMRHRLHFILLYSARLFIFFHSALLSALTTVPFRLSKTFFPKVASTFRPAASLHLSSRPHYAAIRQPQPFHLASPPKRNPVPKLTSHRSPPPSKHCRCLLHHLCYQLKGHRKLHKIHPFLRASLPADPVLEVFMCSLKSCDGCFEPGSYVITARSVLHP